MFLPKYKVEISISNGTTDSERCHSPKPCQEKQWDRIQGGKKKIFADKKTSC